MCGHRPAGPPSGPRPARGGRLFGPAVRPPVRPPPAVGGGRFASAGCGGRAGGPWRPPRAGRGPAGGPAVRWPSTSVNRPCYSCKPCYSCNTPPCYSCKHPLSIAGVNPVAAAGADAVRACATRLASRELQPAGSVTDYLTLTRAFGIWEAGLRKLILPATRPLHPPIAPIAPALRAHLRRTFFSPV